MLGLVSKDITEFLEKNSLDSLSDDELIECYLVASASKQANDFAPFLHSKIRKRDIGFPDFFYFTKHVFSSGKLANLSRYNPEGVKRVVAEFDSYMTTEAKNSARRQKGALFARLYAMFYELETLTSITKKDIDELLSQIKQNHYNFRGDRKKALARNDLYGIISFVEVASESNGNDVPIHLFETVLTSDVMDEKNSAIIMSRLSDRCDAAKLNPPFLFLDELHEKYLNTLVLTNTKDHNSALKYYKKYIRDVLCITQITTLDDLTDVLEKGRVGELRFFHYYVNEVDSQQKVRSKAVYLRDLMLYAMTEFDLERDIYEPVFNDSEWQRIERNNIGKTRGASSSSETPKALIPYRVHQMALEILTDPNYTWAKTIDNQYFTNEEGNKNFNPTLNNLLSLLFILPIRAIQAQVLDSGEGDVENFDVEQSIWGQNVGEHATYWLAKGSANVERGFLRKDQALIKEARKIKDFDANGSPIVRKSYLYINTNKTQDRSVAFSDVSGYVIPWHNEGAIKVYNKQRKFILEHHRVDAPSKFDSVKQVQSTLGTKPTESRVKLIPERFYLFRCNLNFDQELRDLPPTKALITKFWNALMVEIQRRLDDEGADFRVLSEEKVDKYNRGIGGGTSYLSYLTPHCTRVTGITRLEEHGVPIELISKFIAGHANVRTTYHYVKHEKEFVEKQISTAQASIADRLQISLSANLKNAKIDDAMTMAYIPDIYRDCWDQIRERSWNSNKLGICPNAATLCEEGRKNTAFEFTGVGKCVNCKYLISGKSYLINIWNHINKRLYHVKECSDEYSALQKEHKNLIKQRKFEYKMNGKSAQWASLNKGILALESHLESNTVEEQLVWEEVYYSNLLFEDIRALTNTDDDYVHGLNSQECSNFEHLNSIVESDTFIPHFQRDKNLKFKRDAFVERALIAIGEAPIFLQPLSHAERNQAISAVAKQIVIDLEANEGKFVSVALQLEDLVRGDDE